MVGTRFSRCGASGRRGAATAVAATLVLVLAACTPSPAADGGTDEVDGSVAALTAPAPGTTMFGTTTPPGSADADTKPTVLGTRFTVDVGGRVTALRFYKHRATQGPFEGTLWTGTGTRLASVKFASTTRSGWQQANLTSAVQLTAGQVYVVSYFAPYGRYASTVNGLAAERSTGGPVRALRDGDRGVNGIYSYGGGSSFPTATYRSEAYYADVVFVPGDGAAVAPTTTAPSQQSTTTTSTTVPTTTIAPTTTTTTTTTTTLPSGGGAQPPVAAPAGTNWRLAFNEDFTSGTLDLNKWTPCFSWAWSYDGCTASFNNGRERYSPSQVQINNGVASLVAQPATPVNGKDYVSGMLSTTNRPMSSGNPNSLFKFRYGYLEGRMKLPRSKGMFAAFWLLPPDYNNWNYPYEVDVFETLGSTDRTTWMHVHHTNRTIAWDPNGSGGNGACPTQDYADGFHTYGINWQPTFIDFYIDGRRCGSFTGPVWSGDLEVIINLMVDVDWQRQWGLAGATVSDRLDVDYVKVWQAG
ncbi:MAG: DUF4082 domain-containing protein, partial [Microthrixaceae bacterium]